MKQMKDNLKQCYDMKDMGERKKILGIRVEHDRQAGTLTISQREYIDKMLRSFNMIDVYLVSSPCKKIMKSVPLYQDRIYLTYLIWSLLAH